MKQKILRALGIINHALGTIIIHTLLLAAFVLAEGLIFVLVWNHSMPYIFGLPVIGITQAICLQMVIAALLSGIVLSLQALKKK